MPKWWPPGELTPMNSLWGLCQQCPCPDSQPQLPPASLGDPPKPAGRSGPGSYGVTALPWVPMQAKPCVRPPRVETVSPSPVELLHSSPTGLQSQVLWGSSSPCQTPRLGSLVWGSELSLLWENLCDIIIFQFVGRPPGAYGI